METCSENTKNQAQLRFDDPVGYLAGLGIVAELVDSGSTPLAAAA